MMKNLMVAGVMVSLMSAANAGTYNSFDYLTVSYQNEDVTVSPVVEGVNLELSKSVGDVFYVNAQASILNGLGVDYDTYRFGVGARLEVTNLIFPTSLYGEGYVLRDEVQAGRFLNADSWGYGFEGGGRFQVLETLELNAGVAGERFTSTEKFVPYGVVGARWNVFQSDWALVGDARLREGLDRYTIGVSYNF